MLLLHWDQVTWGRLSCCQMAKTFNEWVAVNTVDFFNQINMLYGTITDFCTEETCPIMSAGQKYEYHWADGQQVKKPIKCSAPKYIDYLMTWVQDQIDDESLFPSKIGKVYTVLAFCFIFIFLGVLFPKNFLAIAKTILKRLFRVYAHIYHHHFKEVCKNQTFKSSDKIQLSYTGCFSWRGSSSQHKLQALHLFHPGSYCSLYLAEKWKHYFLVAGVWFDWEERVSPTTWADRQADLTLMTN